MSTLTADQTVAIDKFLALKVGAVFMKQGTGKTRVAVEIANATDIDRVLYVTPCSVRGEARAECERWGLRHPVEIIGYETIGASDRAYMELLSNLTGRIFLIADESIFIKNADAKRTSRMAEIRRRCAYALILNGTPTTRDLFDLKRQIDLLDPRIIGMSDNEFRQNYYTQIAYKKSGGSRREFFKVYEPNVAHLQALIAPYVFHADLDFRYAVDDETVTHEPSSATRDAYAKAKRRTLDDYRASGGSAILAALSHLNHVANSDPAKISNVADHVRGRRVLVYCAHLDEQNAIATQCDGLVINSSTPMVERQRIRDEFTTGSRPLLMTYGTGAFGLNLQAANEIHFATLTFDYAHIDHAKARIRRLGQESAIRYVWHMSGLGISDMIRQNLHRKEWLAEIVRRDFDMEGNL